MKVPYEGRRGPRIKEQRRREILKSAMTRAQNKYGLGGTKKSGANAPRPITLPTIKE
jgi:hypothetical protein